MQVRACPGRPAIQLVAQLLAALGRVCDEEGLTPSSVHSVLFLDDEIEVIVVRRDGSRRHNIYPLATLLDPPGKASQVGDG